MLVTGKFEFLPSRVNRFTVWRPVRVFNQVAVGCAIGLLGDQGGGAFVQSEFSALQALEGKLPNPQKRVWLTNI